MTDCFTFGDITVPAYPSDPVVTLEEVEAMVDNAPSIPSSMLRDYYNCVVRHWDHQHFTVIGDNVTLKFHPVRGFEVWGDFTDLSGVTGYDGLVIPPSGSILA